MLTRMGVAKKLGKSLATVRRMEGHELHPEVDENGVHLFDEDEVDDLARTRGYGPRYGERQAQAGRAKAGAASDDDDTPSGRRPRPHGSDATQRSIVAGLRIESRSFRTELEAARAETAALKERLEEAERDEKHLKGLLRTMAWLVLKVCPSSTLASFDPRLVATVRAYAKLED